MIFAVDFQKSNYSNGYYINVGVSLKALHPELKNPQVVGSDIKSRFWFKDRNTDLVDLDEVHEGSVIIKSLSEEIERWINPTLVEGIKRAFEINPVLILQTKTPVQEYLNIDRNL